MSRKDAAGRAGTHSAETPAMSVHQRRWRCEKGRWLVTVLSSPLHGGGVCCCRVGGGGGPRSARLVVREAAASRGGVDS